MPDLKNKVPDLGAKVADPKLEVPDLRSGGIRLNLTPGYLAAFSNASRSNSSYVEADAKFRTFSPPLKLGER